MDHEATHRVDQPGARPAVIVAAGVGAYFWLFAPQDAVSTGRTVSVQSGNVSETVTATGTVETAGTVELSFGTGGTVTQFRWRQGDTVKAGKALVSSTRRRATGARLARSSYVQAVDRHADSRRLTLAAAQQAVADAQAAAELNKRGYEQAVAQARTALTDAKARGRPRCLDPAGTCPDDAAWAQLRAPRPTSPARRPPTTRPSRPRRPTRRPTTSSSTRPRQPGRDPGHQDSALQHLRIQRHAVHVRRRRHANAQQQYELPSTATRRPRSRASRPS